MLHGAGVALFVALFGLLLCQTLRLDGVVYVVPVVLALAGYSRGGRRVKACGWRSSSSPIWPSATWRSWWLFTTASHLLGSSARPVWGQQGGAVEVPPLAGPVVLVVFDEFRHVDHAFGRYDQRHPTPTCARLAGTTWFRNAASESRTTYVSAVDPDR